MRRKKVRIIIDTNLWISFLLSKSLEKLDQLFSNNSATLIFSQELIDEFIEVAQRPKFKKYFEASDLEDLILHIRSHGEFIHATTHVDLCMDKKDNFLLSLAKDGKAHFLLTGDNDLLQIGKIGKTSILTFTQFLEIKLSTRLK